MPHQAWPLVGKSRSRMIKHFFRVCRPGIALAALLALICLSADGGAYLPLIGPARLRFEAASIPARVFSWASPIADKPAAAAETNLPQEMSGSPTKIDGAITSVDATTNSPVPPLPENLSANSTAETHSANNLLVVTPEMLVDYFKPGNDSTNQTNVRVAAPVGFMPPPSAASPSSQAIYRSQ